MKDQKPFPPQLIAFIPIGAALLVIGINNNHAFIGAGGLFLIIGLAALVRKKRTRHQEEIEKSTPKD